MSNQELWQEINYRYPNLSLTIAKTMTASVFSRLAELNFPPDGDDEVYAKWFMEVYSPTVRDEERNSLDNYLF